MVATGADVSEREEQLVAFYLADEIYGMQIGHINEIILPHEITQIPRTAPDVEGVINLRGRIVPILDLRKRLGLAPQERTPKTRIIVVEYRECTVGLVVDGVRGVLRIPHDQIEPPSELVSGLDSDFVSGIGKHNETLIILLHLPQVLRFSEELP